MKDQHHLPSSPTEEPDLTGRTLGDFRLLRRLGRGAMATVYLAEQRSLGRRVALKILKASLACEEKYVRRFHHEARAAASLVHANIVQIYEVGCVEGFHFIAQEYVQGQNLQQLMAREGAAGAELAVTILRQVAAALHKAGKQGIIHRDIKPENVMLAQSGEVKVADFGLARVMDQSDALHLTEVGVTLGTPLYMSPEQVEGKPLDPRSDLYSLGVTCYHLLSGRPPFEGETALSVAVQHLNKPAGRLAVVRPDLPQGLCRVIHTLMEKPPERRYPSAAALLADLKALNVQGLEEDEFAELLDGCSAGRSSESVARLQATERLEAVMKTSATMATRTRERRGWMWKLAVGSAVALTVGVMAAYYSQRPFLLADPQGERSDLVERRENVKSQYFYAVIVDSEQAWKSVWQHFPPEESEENKYYARRAKQQLARRYLRQNELDKAMELFTELAGLDPTEEEFRAFGLAGQAQVYSLRGDHDRAAEKLADVEPFRDALDEETRDEIDRLKKIQQKVRNGRPE